jgi:hypothetical protein
MSTDLIETSKLTKSIIIPTSSKQQNHSNIEEMMMTTAAQIRDLKSGASAAAAALATSQNVTESVPVPSSEHVAEIVGRQGCKIKALRAKTNTYIKTPVRGEAPMFVITGRKEDVHTAKREIQLAADHFSQIRARRGGNGSSSSCSGQQLSPIGSNDLLPSSIKIDQSNNNASLLSSSSGSSSSSISVSPPTISNICLSSSSSSSCNHHHHNHHQQRSNSTSPNILIKPIIITSENNNELLTDDNASSIVHQLTSQQLQPGHIVKKVSVPYQVVGLVVGPKGSTIKRIQQNTNTYIVTPSRDSQPVFEIQGLPQHVEAAKIEIENYILLRTATTTPTPPLATTTTTTTKSVSPQPLNNDDNFILNFASDTNKLEFEFYNNVIDIIDDLKLMSPNSSSLFKSVADVVNDEDSTFSNSSNSSTSSSSSNNQQSNIWSSPQMNNDDQLFKHRSSISSSSSESSSTCNDVFSSNSSQTASLPLFINNNNNSFDFSTSIMSSFGTNNDNKSSIIGNVDPFLSSNSYATSLTSDTTNVAALNTLFQQHEHLLLNSSSNNNNNSNDSFNYLTSVTNEFNFLSLNNHQQSQQQFY